MKKSDIDLNRSLKNSKTGFFESLKRDKARFKEHGVKKMSDSAIPDYIMTPPHDLIGLSNRQTELKRFKPESWRCVYERYDRLSNKFFLEKFYSEIYYSRLYYLWMYYFQNPSAEVYFESGYRLLMREKQFNNGLWAYLVAEYESFASEVANSRPPHYFQFVKTAEFIVHLTTFPGSMFQFERAVKDFGGKQATFKVCQSKWLREEQKLVYEYHHQHPSMYKSLVHNATLVRPEEKKQIRVLPTSFDTRFDFLHSCNSDYQPLFFQYSTKSKPLEQEGEYYTYLDLPPLLFYYCALHDFVDVLFDNHRLVMQKRTDNLHPYLACFYHYDGFMDVAAEWVDDGVLYPIINSLHFLPKKKLKRHLELKQLTLEVFWWFLRCLCREKNPLDLCKNIKIFNPPKLRNYPPHIQIEAKNLYNLILLFDPKF